MEYISNSERVLNLLKAKTHSRTYTFFLFFFSLTSDGDHCLTFTLLNLPLFLPTVCYGLRLCGLSVCCNETTVADGCRLNLLLIHISAGFCKEVGLLYYLMSFVLRYHCSSSCFSAPISWFLFHNLCIVALGINKSFSSVLSNIQKAICEQSCRLKSSLNLNRVCK